MFDHLEEIAATVVLFSVLGFLAYTQVPRHWQTPLGFLLIVFGWMPAAVIVFCIMKEPGLLIPAVFVLGVFTAYRKRA
jgi:hypothetical protein